jgi:galactokinase
MWVLLSEFGIKTWNHYSPMHLSSSFRSRLHGKGGDCPVAEAKFEQYVSLPIHPRLTEEAIAYMIDAIKQLSQRPHIPRLSPAPLLNALMSLYVDNDSANTPDLLAEKDWEEFKSEVQTSALFSYSAPITTARAPGRLDLMGMVCLTPQHHLLHFAFLSVFSGGNDDYTGGLVFECTISEATFVAAQARMTDSIIIVRNRQLCPEDCSVPVALLVQPGLTAGDLAVTLKAMFPNSRWQLYVVGVLLWLTLRYPSLMFAGGQHGLSLLVRSSVPLNRGVSSSASVEVATMKAAAKAFGISIDGETLATACQWVENEVCSSACGLMDQMAVTLGSPFMCMRCQPAQIVPAPPLPCDLTVFAMDSGVSHEVSGIEYEAARAAAFMGYKIICDLQGISVVKNTSGEIARFTDCMYSGYLANMAPSLFARQFERTLPEQMSGREFIERYGFHADPATQLLPEHVYNVRANTKYAVFENNRVSLFYNLIKGCPSSGGGAELYSQLGELMYAPFLHPFLSFAGLKTVSLFACTNRMTPTPSAGWDHPPPLPSLTSFAACILPLGCSGQRSQGEGRVALLQFSACAQLPTHFNNTLFNHTQNSEVSVSRLPCLLGHHRARTRSAHGSLFCSKLSTKTKVLQDAACASVYFSMHWCWSFHFCS